jgi:drug/metabolite transporter (DMT)-like permease
VGPAAIKSAVNKGQARGEMPMRLISMLALIFAVSTPACIVAGGYSNDGGWFLWPGSLVTLLVVGVLAFLLLRRRR